MRKLLQKILKVFSKLVLKKYKPVIIAITGSVGKTSTKEAIFAVLKNHFGEKRIRRNQRNYNNEIGVPLTIFGLETGGRSILRWIPRFAKIFWMLVFRTSYPDFLVLEMGADRPGDINYLTNFVKPRVSVITAVGEIPVHVEFYKGPDQVAEEKKNLIKCLDKDDVAVLNNDDERVKKMREGIGAEVMTYGIREKSDIMATNYDLKIGNNGNAAELNFKLDFKGSSVPAKLINVLGVQNLYSALAGAAVGIIFGINLVEISEALKKLRPLPGRMSLLKGVKNTLIVDDSYNASLLAMEAGLESLKIFENNPPAGRHGRKVLALGDMLEIGEYAQEAHERIGRKAAGIADLIFVVGNRAKFISEAAKKEGFPADKIFEFDTADQAGLAMQKELKGGDIVFIKGSRAMKMEKVVEELLAR